MKPLPRKSANLPGPPKRTEKGAARALVESENRFRAVVEQTVAAVYVIQNRKIVYVNPRMRELFGYGPGEAFEPDPLAHVKETDWLKVIEQMRRRPAAEREAAFTVTALRKDGSEFQFGIHSTRAMYEGRPAIIAVAQDITDKLRAEAQVQHHLSQLRRAIHGTIDVISIIGEMRDPYTHGHERRVGHFAAAIGTEMGLPPDQVEGLRVAGYVHDCGKIGIPSELLSKPTRLTPAEFALIKCHAQKSHDILRTVDFPWPVAQAALQHHERLDGTGYPLGLRGDAIVLESRILCVADVVEAMASHRPYRPGLGIDKALEEVEGGRRRHYDADVVDACLRLFRDNAYRLPD